jgi:hypothetical protein
MSERLELPKNDFVSSLELLQKTATRFDLDEAVMSFDGACLHIELGGATVLVPAKGSLDGQFRMRAEALFLWIEAPPAGDPIVFDFDGDEMKFGRCSTRVHRQPAWSKTIELPINATLLDVLALPGKYSREQLEQAGLWQSVVQATDKLWTAFEKSEEDFTELGLKPGDLFDCMIDGIEKKYGPGLNFD